MSETVSEKWKSVMQHDDLPEIKDTYKRDVTLRLLETQEKFLQEAAPTVSTTGQGGGFMPDTTGVAKWDPILIALVRRAMPQMIAYDVCGVQPMSGPTGLIFAMRSKYDGFTGAGDAGEAFGALGTAADEADTGHSEANAAATTAHTTSTSSANPFTGTWNTGDGMTTAAAEAMGDAAGNSFSEMAFTIEKSSVTAVSRALKAEYSTELAQDLKAVHGLDAETELANILSTEILQEINREVIRTIYKAAKKGAAVDTATQYTFDLDTDSNGRWSVEKFKGLLYQIERDRNEIGHTTRRGRGNFVICSADVASALAMAGVLDYAPAIDTNIKADDTMSTFAGTMNGMKVYVDPYYTSEVGQMYVVGYKGSSSYDAGMFYCPYVPLQMVRAMGENTFQPKIGFKTRYGLVANPFTSNAAHTNTYYRKVLVTNLM